MSNSTGKPPFTANQRFLVGTSFLLCVLAVFCFRILSALPDGRTPASCVAAALAVLALVLLLVVRYSRRRGNRRGSMSHLIRSSALAGHGFTDVEITSDQVLPPLCIRCGEATTRISPFRFHGLVTKSSPYDWSRANPLFLIIIAVRAVAKKLWELAGSLLTGRHATGELVEFKIPHCKQCASGNPVVQRHFDFHGRRMIVEAHPAFRQQLRKRPRV